MSQQRIFLYLFATLCLVHTVHAFVEGLYCGTANCYEVLGVTREVTKRELSRSYRKLARKFHPDMSKEPDADVKFRAIATAYEILKDDDSRTDYDYMLDNPEEAYYHYYRFYRRRLTPKVDVRYVLAVTITVISVLQYLHKVRRITLFWFCRPFCLLFCFLLKIQQPQVSRKVPNFGGYQGGMHKGAWSWWKLSGNFHFIYHTMTVKGPSYNICII